MVRPDQPCGLEPVSELKSSQPCSSGDEPGELTQLSVTQYTLEDLLIYSRITTTHTSMTQTWMKQMVQMLF